MSLSPSDRRAGPAGRRSFGPALWLLLLGFLLALAAVFLRFSMLQPPPPGEVSGDGVDVKSYGFVLEPSRIPLEEIVAAGVAKGAIPAIDFPALLRPAQVDSINRAERGKYLVPGDEVVGVAAGEKARAYPLRVLAWHEVVNDTLGGVPIAVTYSPLSGGVVVFHRRVGGEEVRFGVSGLLYNSNLLMYDVTAAAREQSLWSQLGRRAVVGPAVAAGRRLNVLPCALVPWGEWRADHPGTEVIDRDPSRIQAYKSEPYGNYFGNDLLRFPVRPLPEGTDVPWKTRMIVTGRGEEWEAFSIPEIAARAGAAGEWRTRWRGVPIRFTVAGDPPMVRLFPEGLSDPPLVNFYCFYFAWYALGG